MIDNTIFFHGWGYGSLFWQSNVSHYGNTNILLYNRGYYGAYHKPKLPVGKTQCVTHSAGLLFAIQEYNMVDFDKIIIYAGFERFPNKIAAKAMRLGLQKNPEKIMYDFYDACGFIPSVTEKPDIKRLCDDLKMLEICDISEQLKHIQYTAYHGKNDTIIPMPLTGAISIDNTGHLCNLI